MKLRREEPTVTAQVKERTPYPVPRLILTKPDVKRYELPAYDPETPCPSCGFKCVTTKIDSGYVDGWAGRRESVWPWPRMKRECLNCGRVFYQEPLDTPTDRRATVLRWMATERHAHDIAIWSIHH